MAYRLTYTFKIEWLGAGMGGMTQASAQSIEFTAGGVAAMAGQLQKGAGGQSSPTFTATDITNLTNAAAADMVTQLTAAIPVAAGWATGNP